MASSMIINDLYDIKIDKINYPNRPLVNGELTTKEAIFFTIILLSITQIINIIYMPVVLQKYLYLIIVLINIYTPILKKILFVKNLTCASIVSFSVLFSGLSMYNSNKINQILGNFLINSYQDINIRTRLLLTSSILLFFSSLYCELLLDIGDYKGDKDNNIPTIPVVYGKKFSLILSISLLCFNIFMVYNSLVHNISTQAGILFCLIYLPVWNNFKLLLQNNYSKEIIKKVLIKSTNCLLISLLYICYISATL
jgi:geranylgeranylglycerol-phosphate geranylgeranyltransferase